MGVVDYESMNDFLHFPRLYFFGYMAHLSGRFPLAFSHERFLVNIGGLDSDAFENLLPILFSLCTYWEGILLGTRGGIFLFCFAF